jgi:hypothetical protein
LRSSQKARIASWILREAVRSCVRNRFLASCWVSVEPPLGDAARGQVARQRTGDADRIDAEMLVKAAVLDRDERLRQVRREFLDRNGSPASLAAVGEERAVGGENRDIGRPLRHRELVDRGQLRRMIGNDAGNDDHAPDAEHDGAVDEPAENRAARARRLAAASLLYRPGAARFRHFSSGPVFARQAQMQRRRVGTRIEHRLAPAAALRHRKSPHAPGLKAGSPGLSRGAEGHAKCGGLRGG